jgi:hypothetical protein
MKLLGFVGVIALIFLSGCTATGYFGLDGNALQFAAADDADMDPDPPVCNNDTVCDPGENNMNCPNDCYCGNGTCEADAPDGEDAFTCPQDCGYELGSPCTSSAQCSGIPPSPAFCNGNDKVEPDVVCLTGQCTDRFFGPVVTSNCNNCCLPGPPVACGTATQCGSSCGDSICQSGETPQNCVQDCGFCGDSICSAPESATNCAIDCAPVVCGDMVCSATEDSTTCPVDCPSSFVCGDGICDALWETSTSCNADCPFQVGDACTLSNQCSGNGFNSDIVDPDPFCSGVELHDPKPKCLGGTCQIISTGPSVISTCTNCCLTGTPSSCGTASECSLCGNGTCDASEDETSCPGDCFPGVCGNGFCDPNENGTTCPLDCGVCISNSDCPPAFWMCEINTGGNDVALRHSYICSSSSCQEIVPSVDGPSTVARNNCNNCCLPDGTCGSVAECGAVAPVIGPVAPAQGGGNPGAGAQPGNPAAGAGNGAQPVTGVGAGNGTGITNVTPSTTGTSTEIVGSQTVVGSTTTKIPVPPATYSPGIIGTLLGALFGPPAQPVPSFTRVDTTQVTQTVSALGTDLPTTQTEQIGGSVNSLFDTFADPTASRADIQHALAQVRNAKQALRSEGVDSKIVNRAFEAAISGATTSSEMQTMVMKSVDAMELGDTENAVTMAMAEIKPESEQQTGIAGVVGGFLNSIFGIFGGNTAQRAHQQVGDAAPGPNQAGAAGGANHGVQGAAAGVQGGVAVGGACASSSDCAGSTIQVCVGGTVETTIPKCDGGVCIEFTQTTANCNSGICADEGVGKATCCPSDVTIINNIYNCNAGGTHACCTGGTPDFVCPNGACEAGEDSISCPKDCTVATEWCGDTICNGNPQEDPGTCPADCGGGVSCPNGICELTEDVFSCPNDCATHGGICGDGSCTPADGENAITCPRDCDVGGACGDFVCDPTIGEDQITCPDDCGAGPVCGDGICSIFEDPVSCADDCAVNGFCGDTICDAAIGEDEILCLEDCKSAPLCGNGTCDTGEDWNSCRDDCDEPECFSDADCAAPGDNLCTYGWCYREGTSEASCHRSINGLDSCDSSEPPP